MIEGAKSLLSRMFPPDPRWELIREIERLQAELKRLRAEELELLRFRQQKS